MAMACGTAAEALPLDTFDLLADVNTGLHDSNPPLRTAHLPALDLRISCRSDTDPLDCTLFHGYLINVTEEHTREAKLHSALAQLTGQGKSGTEGIDISEL